jgi:hypothetical protein
VGGPGKARDGRNRAAHGGPDRRPVGFIAIRTKMFKSNLK